jgi:hypothetical protein
MATGPRLTVAPTWTIRSIPIRTRDGPERLDQAYRRLFSDTSPDRLPDRPVGPSKSPPTLSRAPASRR